MLCLNFQTSKPDPLPPRVWRSLDLQEPWDWVWDAYQQSLTAWSMFNDPTLKGSVLPYMQTGVLLGRMTQATTLAVISNTQLAILGLSKGGVSKLASRMFLPVTLGVEGLQFATAYHEYSLGRISQRDLYRRTASPAIIIIFTVGGGIVGGIIGIQAAGITAIPAAVIGANYGAIAAIPVQFTTSYILNWYYRKFDEHQRLVVNAAVEKCYANSGIKQLSKGARSLRTCLKVI